MSYSCTPRITSMAPARRLVDDQVEVLPRAGEVVVQRRRVGVERHEDEIAIGVHARRLGESEGCAVEGRRVARLPGHAVEAPVAVVAPAVIEADESARVAVPLAAHQRTAVAAAVQEHANAARGIAAQDHRPTGDDATLEIARRTHLARMADVDPAAVEDAPALRLEHGGRDEGAAMHAEVVRVRVVDDVAKRGHGQGRGQSHANA